MPEAGVRSLPRPLAGKRVIDLSQFIAGPSAAMYLADYGAEVIKVESPQGDGSRTLPGNGFGSYYTRSFNCGKESRVLDLRDPAQRRRLDDWLAQADAFVCNLAPASLKTLGLDGPTLRGRFPRLVITLISGYGQDDPRPCMDTVAQCESGFALLNGDEDGSPRLATGWPVDMACGLVAGMSCAMAMLDPARQGCVIDISMMEVAANLLLGPAALALGEGGAIGRPMGNRDRASAPSNIYRCADGHVYVLGGLDAYWARLKPLVGCTEDAPIAQRIARAPEFDALVERWTLQHTRDEVLAEMARLQVPAGAVREPAEALDRMRQRRPDAVTRVLASGEHVPTFPALLDGQRLPRTPTPAVGGARRDA
ncbi:CoA transferase [Ramlibacter alkalitolerans]|uniref:CoA transferase n=1 Tax=Ramlibacter alkalitolerans TaxID=2039631 RepID=A0ABS1JM37_9BURK|nr:CoA transferase [Ramlibacter alkalitolerans]MBL0425274.1 CoA transferase [Ramlibacter alkalitolerans]